MAKPRPIVSKVSHDVAGRCCTPQTARGRFATAEDYPEEASETGWQDLSLTEADAEVEDEVSSQHLQVQSVPIPSFRRRQFTRGDVRP